MLKTILLLLLISSCANGKSPTYNRKAWKHWIDEDKDCQNTRQEVLISRSKKSVTFNKKGCTVITGLWDDYYYPEIHHEAKAVDIDHLIPLKHAFDIGGDKWSKVMKIKFANDPDNLVITNKKYNRIKGSKRLDEWLPTHKAYACKYYADWMKVKAKYNLPISQAERESIDTKVCSK